MYKYTPMKVLVLLISVGRHGNGENIAWNKTFYNKIAFWFTFL